MRPLSVAFASALLLSLVPALARAEGLGIGGRVGGYGFRQAPTAGADHTGWNDCRMNGMGIFGDKRYGKHLFLEAGLDAYFADTFPTGGHDHGDGEATMGSGSEMDRMSAIATVAGGFRMWPDGRVSPYVQIGAGLELTKVDMPAFEMEDTFLLPVGFIGFGGDVRIGKHLRLGLNLRVHMMGHFDHDSSDTAMDVEPELAGQGQFYAKYTL
jgi:hypothetical protein